MNQITYPTHAFNIIQSNYCDIPSPYFAEGFEKINCYFRIDIDPTSHAVPSFRVEEGSFIEINSSGNATYNVNPGDIVYSVDNGFAFTVGDIIDEQTAFIDNSSFQAYGTPPFFSEGLMFKAAIRKKSLTGGALVFSGYDSVQPLSLITASSEELSVKVSSNQTLPLKIKKVLGGGFTDFIALY